MNKCANCLLRTPAVLLLGPSIPVLDQPIHIHHKYGVVREIEETCLFPQCFFGALAIVNVSAFSVPLDDFPRFIMQRHIADQQPAILPVRPAHARFSFHRIPGSDSRAPCLDEAGTVLGVNRFCPTPAHALLQREAAEFQPTPIDEIDRAIRPSAPHICRDGVDYILKLFELPLQLPDTHSKAEPVPSPGDQNNGYGADAPEPRGAHQGARTSIRTAVPCRFQLP